MRLSLRQRMLGSGSCGLPGLPAASSPHTFRGSQWLWSFPASRSADGRRNGLCEFLISEVGSFAYEVRMSINQSRYQGCSSQIDHGSPCRYCARDAGDLIAGYYQDRTIDGASGSYVE